MVIMKMVTSTCAPQQQTFVKDVDGVDNDDDEDENDHLSSAIVGLGQRR